MAEIKKSESVTGSGMRKWPESHREIEEWLESNGWVEHAVVKFDRHTREWFKAFPDENRCQTNWTKPLQLRVSLWEFGHGGKKTISLEMALRAEPVVDKGWVALTAYGLSCAAELPLQCERLLAAWRAITELEDEQ